jgi:hypothetical protein
LKNDEIPLIDFPHILQCDFGAEAYKAVEARLVENNKVLLITFENSSNSRRVSLNPTDNVITFKGTTLNDMKWSSSFDNVEYLSVNESGVFTVKIKERASFDFGLVNEEIITILSKHLGKH